MSHFAITAIGADRPGIVAGLTEALRDVGGNLEDVSSTILRGHFAMMFVVDAPAGATPAAIEETLVSAAGPLGVSITVADVESAAPGRPSATHALTVYGADKPGIVAGFARLLAERRVNVTDLTCRLVGEDRPVYVMVAELAVPDDADAVARAIAAAADDLGVDAAFQSREADTF